MLPTDAAAGRLCAVVVRAVSLSECRLLSVTERASRANHLNDAVVKAVIVNSSLQNIKNISDLRKKIVNVTLTGLETDFSHEMVDHNFIRKSDFLFSKNVL